MFFVLRPRPGREGEAADAARREADGGGPHTGGVSSLNFSWEHSLGPVLFCCKWKGRERTGAGREVGLDNVRLRPTAAGPPSSHVLLLLGQKSPTVSGSSIPHVVTC